MTMLVSVKDRIKKEDYQNDSWCCRLCYYVRDGLCTYSLCFFMCAVLGINAL